jgi:hypothetical protein
MVSAQAPDWDWVKTSVIQEGASVNGTAVDSSGNVFITGYFNHTMTLGSYTLDNTLGNSQLFYAKYDNEGNVLWAKTVMINNLSAGQSITTDTDGNAYMTGSFFTSLTMDSITIIGDNPSQWAMFIAKIDPLGNLIWLKQNMGDQTTPEELITTDNAVYLKGFFEGNTTSLGNITLTNSNSYRSFFLAKYDTSGNVLWAKTADGLVFNENTGNMALDNHGNIYITGSFIDSQLTFDNFTVTQITGERSIYLVCINKNGTTQWLKNFGENCFAGSVAVDTQNNIYLSGSYRSSTIELPPFTLTNTGDYNTLDSFLYKMNPEGSGLWVKEIGGNNSEFNTKLAIDSNDEVYIVGNLFSISLLIDGDEMTEEGDYSQLYVVSFTTEGNFKWIKTVICNGITYLSSSTLASNGNLIIGGYITKETLFDETSFNLSDNSNFFVAKLNNIVLDTPQFIKQVTLYPNPAKDILNISADFEGTKYSIIDTLGRTITTGTLQNNSINVAALPKGLYILKSSNALNTKFIKE